MKKPMSDEKNIFTLKGAQQILARLDKLNGENYASGSKALEESGDKVEILRDTLLQFAARNEELERQTRDQAKMEAIAKACADIRANLALPGKAIEKNDAPDELSRLYKYLLWLISKFRRSSSFPLFDVNPATAGADKIFAGGGKEIIFAYQAALGVASIDEIYKTCREYGRIYAKLPENTRQFFPAAEIFDGYFAEVVTLLMRIAELPAKALAEACKASQKRRGDEPLAAKIFAQADSFAPAGAHKTSLKETKKKCKSLESALARDLVVMNRNLQTLLAIALAIFPNGGWRDIGEYYRKDGPGDPDRADGPLNQFIRNSKI